MKTYILFGVITWSFIATCFAEKVRGQIFWKNDSLTYVTFIIPGNSDEYEVNLIKVITIDEIQNEIKYYDSGSNEKKTLLPEQAKEIRFYYRGDSVRMVSCHNTLELKAYSPGILGFKESRSYIFLRINIDGRLKLFTFYNRTPSGPYGGMEKVEDKPIIQTENGEFFRPRQVGFKKIMKTHLSDCKEVVAKIVMEEYTYANIYTIVREYNKCIK